MCSFWCGQGVWTSMYNSLSVSYMEWENCFHSSMENVLSVLRLRGFLACTVHFKRPQGISVGLVIVMLQGLYDYSLTLSWSTLLYDKKLIVDSTLLGTNAATQPQIIIFPPLSCTVGIRFWFLFSPNIPSSIVGN